MNEPLWRIGLRELWKGLHSSTSETEPDPESRKTIKVSLSPEQQVEENPWSAAALRRKGHWLSGLTVALFACGIVCWFVPLSDPNSRSMISGIFLKLGLFFAGMRLAWPQLCYLFQFKIGFAGVILLMVAGIIFVVRPRAALVAWPLLVTLAGGLTFLGWLSQQLQPKPPKRKASPKNKPLS